MSDSPQVPPGWFPDPTGAAALRYWDGTQWTEHVSALPQSEQQTAAGGAPDSPSRRAEKSEKAEKPRKPRVWNRTTWIILGVCVALVATGLVWHSNVQRDVGERAEGDADEVLTTFLDRLTEGDPEWRDLATDSYLDFVDDRDPVRGDPTAAQLLDLKIDYRFEPFEYSRTQYEYPLSSARGSDLASTTVHFEYRYTLDGTPFTSEVSQSVYLTRPYYYDGSDHAGPAHERTSEQPTAIGPWQVTNLNYGNMVESSGTDSRTTTDYRPAAPNLDPTACTVPRQVFRELSETARVSGTATTDCAHGANSAFAVADDVDPQQLAADFPVLTRYSPAPPEIMLLRGANEYFVPFKQYRMSAGGESYVFTFAAEREGTISTFRLIALSKGEK